MKRGKASLLAALIALAVPSAAAAQRGALAAPLLERMTGRWVLRGTIDGQPTTHDVRADWLLQHEYLRLTEVSRERDARGRPAYEAIVVIGADPNRPGFACLWLDNTGGGGLNGRAIAHAEPITGDSIGFVFAIGDSGTFQTSFVYERGGDRWRWLMDAVAADGRRQPFARLVMTRAR